MQRILEICVDLDGGGIDRFLFNYCSRIKDVLFDFVLVNQNKKGILEDTIKDMGSHIYYVSPMRDGIKKNASQLMEIMHLVHYDAVHAHLGYKSFNALRCAKKSGIKTRIAHAHIAKEKETIANRVVRFFCSFLTKKYATNLAACGLEAAKWCWGKKMLEKGKITIHNNAIETTKYKFSLEKRKHIRDELKINDKIVVGHVGRICEQKNQIRLIKIFSAFKKIKKNSVLIIVGRDSLNGECQNLAKTLGLENDIVFLGVRDDIQNLLNAFDLFVFPSLFEGLPFTIIEAECNGIPIVMSDKITGEVIINNNVKALSLDENDSKWASICDLMLKQGRIINGDINVANKGYDLEIESKKLRNYYDDCIESNNDRQ